MPIRVALSVSVVAAMNAVASASSLPEAAMRALDGYVLAFNSYDCSAVLAHASPVFVDLLGKDSDARKAYCAYIDELKKESATCVPGRVIAAASEAQHRLYFVENLCSAREPASYPSVAMAGFYVLHSSDSGATWAVLDQTCTPEQLIVRAYPPYKGEPPLPQVRIYLPPWATR